MGTILSPRLDPASSDRVQECRLDTREYSGIRDVDIHRCGGDRNPSGQEI